MFSFIIDKIDFKSTDRKYEAFCFLMNQKYENINNGNNLNEIIETNLQVVRHCFFIIGRHDLFEKLSDNNAEEDLKKLKWPNPIPNLNHIKELIVYCWLQILPAEEEENWKQNLIQLIKDKKEVYLPQDGSLFELLHAILQSGFVTTVKELDSCLPLNSLGIFEEFKKFYELEGDDDHLRPVMFQPDRMKSKTDYYEIKKGFVLILNDKSRQGSNEDVNKIKMTFKVFEHKHDEMYYFQDHEYKNHDLLKVTMETLLPDKYDCLIVFIVADGNDENVYFDNLEVSRKSIIDLFKQCKLLVGKPKVFIFQCYGRDKQTEDMSHQSIQSGVVLPKDENGSAYLQTDGPSDAVCGSTEAACENIQYVPEDSDIYVVDAKHEAFIKIFYDKLKNHGKSRTIVEIRKECNEIGYPASSAESSLSKTLILGRDCD